jgi:NAD(P)-dependent dehydrogenase (short-subunit alcohol dehydrogenase family)
MEIAGTIALVTGAGSGIGRAVAGMLAARGAKAVGLVDRAEAVHEAAREIATLYPGTAAEAFVGDVTDADFRASVYDQMQTHHGCVAICVPAAGVINDALLAKLDKATGRAALYPAETFRQVVEVNLIAPLYWAAELVGRVAEERAAKGLKRWTPDETDHGSVVFLGSVAARGNAGQVVYSATKAGLAAAAESLAKEAAYHGVRAAVVHPGMTDTPMMRGALDENALNEQVRTRTRLGRLLRPEEIAEAIGFLITCPAVDAPLWLGAGWWPPP